MNRASYTSECLLAACGTTAAIMLSPGLCPAADSASLPWDYTLQVIQSLVAGPLAQFVIVVSGIITMLAFVLAGDNEFARRFAKTAFATAFALMAVQLLNYLAP